MTTLVLSINGQDREVEVDDAFEKFSPQKQQEQANLIAAHLTRQAKGAQPAPERPTETSFGSALGYGANAALNALRATGRITGLTDAPDVDYNEGRAAAYQPAGPKVAESFNQGNYGDALSYLPRAAVEGLPAFAGVAGAGALGAMALPAAPVAAGLIGAGGASAVLNAGSNVEATAANNDRSTPSTGDYVQGLGVTAGQAALDAIGARGARVLAGAGRAPGMLGRVADSGRHAALEGGTSGVQSILQQGGTSIGTERGLSVDPGEAASAAAQGIAMRGATDVTHGAGRIPRDVARRMSESRAARELGVTADNPNAAESVVRLGNALDEMRRTAPDGTTDEALMGDLVKSGEPRALELLRQARDNLWIERGEYQKYKSEIENATKHTRALLAGDPDAVSQGREPLGLAAIDEMDAPAAWRSDFKALLSDLDMASRAARMNRSSGPAETIGAKLGQVIALGGAGAAMAHGNVYAAVPMAALGLSGGSGAQAIGSRLGRMADNWMGTRQPMTTLARGRAQEVLQKAGRNTDDDTLKVIRRLRDGADDPASAAAPDPADPAIREDSQWALRTAKAQWKNGIEPSLLERLTPDDRNHLERWIELEYVKRDQSDLDAERKANLKAAEDRQKAELRAQEARAQDLDRAFAQPAARTPDVERAMAASERAATLQKARQEESMWRDVESYQEKSRSDLAAINSDALKRLMLEQRPPTAAPIPRQLAPGSSRDALNRARAQEMAAELASPEAAPKPRRARAPRKPAEAPEAVPAMDTPPPPSAAPSVDPTASVATDTPSGTAQGAGWRGDVVPNWMGRAMDFAADRGTPVSADHIEAAVDALAERGVFSPRELSVIRDRNNNRLGGDDNPKSYGWLQRITQEAIRQSGGDPRAARQRQAIGGGSDVSDPIRDPARYDRVREDRKELAKEVMQTFATQGDTAGVGLMMKLRSNTLGKYPQEERIADIERLIEASPTPEVRAMREALLRGLVPMGE